MFSLIAAALAIRHQTIAISVDVKPGESISGVRHFRVDVSSNDPVTQVEFYVGSELKDSDSSVPYEFNLDTIDENDGNLPLTFAAYTSKGDSQKKVIDVVIDNGVALGAPAHDQKGIDFLHDSKWDDAILQARIALKIAPEDNQARMVMARAFLGQGILDKAEKYAEDWHQSAPTDTDASELLSDIDMHRAFDTMSSGKDRDVALKQIHDSFKNAVDTRQALLQEQLDKIGTPTPDNLLNYADTAISARRYSLAITALTGEYQLHVDRNDVTNRLAYAQLLSGRVSDAYATLLQVKRLAKLDAYGNALMSLVLYVTHDQKGSDEYMKDATDIDSTDVGVRTAEAYIALSSGKIDVLSQLDAALLNDAGDLPEVNYYLEVLANSQGNFDDGRKYFETMALADPLSEAGYLEEANNDLLFAVRSAKGDQVDRVFRAMSAQALFEIALEVRPESYRALLGLSFVAMILKQNQAALKFATAAVMAAPTEPATLYAQSAALSLNDQANAAYNADRQAWRYDETELGGRAVPKPLEAWGYYVRYDRIPIMALPK